jgi:hypothetical protein
MDGPSSVSTEAGVSAGASKEISAGPVDVKIGAEAGLGGKSSSNGSREVSATVKVGSSASDAVNAGAEGSIVKSTDSEGRGKSEATAKVSGSAMDSVNASAETRMSLMSGSTSADILR